MTESDGYERRRADLAAAVWRVLDHSGFAGLSMRAVARELDATTGIVTHYFPSKWELTNYALTLLAEQSQARARPDAAAGADALRTTLLGTLPLDETSRAASRIWVSSWDAALADERHADQHAERYRVSRAKVRSLVAKCLPASDNAAPCVDRIAEQLHSFVLGLSVQAVLDPAAYPPDQQVALLDDVLSRIMIRGHLPPGETVPVGITFGGDST